MHLGRSLLLHMELMIRSTEEQDQLLYILSLGANWSRTGSLSPLVCLISLIRCNIERKVELDDVSYECASENVRTNNMESRIHLAKATREGSILFTLEGNNESKFVKSVISYIGTLITLSF